MLAGAICEETECTGLVMIGPVALASVPVAVWQRRVTRRELGAGDRQSSLCSTA
jgi:hypothetical protein